MNWLRLIRWKNLLIVFLTQLLVWYCLVYCNAGSIRKFIGSVPGAWEYSTDSSFFSQLIPFLLISLSTVLIAAAGYIINDYFDLKIDVINRPDKVVLEKKIPLRTAIVAHSILNIAGFLLAAVLAHKASHYEWLAIQVTCSVLLWFYSTHFKKQFITGNVVVAVLTALTIVVLVVYLPTLYMFFDFPPFIRNDNGQLLVNPLWMCGGYSLFAFLTTWMREIVKDMEDYKGDAAEGCMTMPIKKGLEYSMRFTITIGVGAILVLSAIAYYLLINQYLVLGVYAAALIVLPLIAWCMFLPRKNTIAHYHTASRWLKIIMLSGIGSLIVYHFSIAAF